MQHTNNHFGSKMCLIDTVNFVVKRENDEYQHFHLCQQSFPQAISLGSLKTGFYGEIKGKIYMNYEYNVVKVEHERNILISCGVFFFK